ncbi:MAG: hypothetical protein GQ474_04340 [Sulfurimonas sp.]|nr:hypothetical protein [Sulfurimonas sp.]
MELPALMLFEIKDINLQGFVFVLPLILIVLSVVYFKRVKKMTNTILFIFLLLFLSFIPQAYHTFFCEECYLLECSEFYTFAGLLMIVATSLVIYALDRQLDEGDTL